jgi:ParB family chromosome partitioning protein
MWQYHDRLGQTITEESCAAEIASFKAHGQQVNVLGRPLQDDPQYDAELIFGARRLFVARHLQISLKVELQQLTDREAIIALDIENRQRRDISPYERGLSYASWLRARHFNSQEEIALALKISASQVSRLLNLARLPSVVVEAFGNPSELREGWGNEIYRAWQDPLRRRQIADRARAIVNTGSRPKAQKIYDILLRAERIRPRAAVPEHDEVVQDWQGAPLFRVRHNRETIAFMIPSAKADPETLERIKSVVLGVLR